MKQLNFILAMIATLSVMISCSLQETHLPENTADEDMMEATSEVGQDEQNALLQAALGADSFNANVSVTTVSGTGLEVACGVLYNNGTPVDTANSELDLSGKNLGDYTFLTEFTQLETLVLSKSDISDLSPLSSMKMLKELYLEDCSLVTSLDPLAGCENLKKIVIGECGVSDLTPLAGLQNLEKLYIDAEGVNDLSALTDLESLKGLDISSSSIKDISPLAEVSTLGWLNLGHTDIDDFSAIASLSEMVELNVMDTAFSDLNLLKKMTNLEKLNILYTNITDITLLTSMDFPALRELCCNATPEEAELLREAFPDCNIVTSEVVE